LILLGGVAVVHIGATGSFLLSSTNSLVVYSIHFSHVLLVQCNFGVKNCLNTGAGEVGQQDCTSTLHMNGVKPRLHGMFISLCCWHSILLSRNCVLTLIFMFRAVDWKWTGARHCLSDLVFQPVVLGSAKSIILVIWERNEMKHASSNDFNLYNICFPQHHL